MKKKCNTYRIVPHNSYLSTKNHLVAKDIIDKYLNIKDINKFREEVTRLTKAAKEKYGIDIGRLFTERTISSADKSYYQAYPNKQAFSIINSKKGDNKPSSLIGDSIIQSLRTETTKPGVTSYEDPKLDLNSNDITVGNEII